MQWTAKDGETHLSVGQHEDEKDEAEGTQITASIMERLRQHVDTLVEAKQFQEFQHREEGHQGNDIRIDFVETGNGIEIHEFT